MFRAKDRIGEVTLVFPAIDPSAAPIVARPPLSDSEIWESVSRLTQAGATRRQAVSTIARQEGRSSGDIYAAAERGKTRPN